MMDPREAKLPRWAQALINTERLHRSIAERRLEEQLATTGKSSVWYGDYDNPVYVPQRFKHPERFHFSTTGSGDLHDEFQAQLTADGMLEISGGRGLVIRPQVSNVIQVQLQP
ncbi:hypothetical protein SEA_SUPERCALLIE99_77 [Mycobacterium phage SuperCallie99]|uniref:Uncharacterized protein n=3 Tax=Gladiatorvirus ericB TaxID=1041406 RepID=A0A7G9A1E2_9CAUD|nr:hypothetical protein AXJ19_gp032 [Mycobacterium phage VohminGhazi]AEK08521.1 hypothetical protein PBI_DAVINCI_78 [Mycobacterium phage DaVinci]AMW64429.1 hypothetical protein PBI_KAZAN_81 [Mycobacterium phage Kazan]QNL30431.1 hypothetical protein SEA_SUPERCALLIE99_77 [Mycobacterium phage SuperCallie99]QYW01279.1 hypothetical protein SEA_HOOT_75 [Mycobacterium phage Hoot]UYL86995.1 hypothetical protein SEA_BABULLSEYE_73 [Mycobacterium phage BABullseye]